MTLTLQTLHLQSSLCHTVSLKTKFRRTPLSIWTYYLKVATSGTAFVKVLELFVTLRCTSFPTNLMSLIITSGPPHTIYLSNRKALTYVYGFLI